MVRKLERKSLWSRLNLLENVYGAGFYGPLFFWLENWKTKIQLHVLSWLITCCFCMKNGSDCMLFFRAENLEKKFQFA